MNIRLDTSDTLLTVKTPPGDMTPNLTKCDPYANIAP